MRKLIILIIPIVLSCNTKSILKEYNYSEDFYLYFENTFNTSLKDQGLKHLFVIPLSSCTPCVNASLNLFLEINREDVGIITVGLPDNSKTFQLVNKIYSLNKVWLDDKEELTKYRTNIGSPYYLSIKNGEIKQGLEIDESKIEQLKTIFKR